MAVALSSMATGGSDVMHRVAAVLLLLAMAVSCRAADLDYALWDGLLHKHVTVLRGGQASTVDYAGMGADRKILDQFLQATSLVTREQFDAWSADSQLAFLINAYNAWTVELILSAYPKVSSIKELGSLLGSPWKKRFIPLLGKTRSLDEIEHDLIRGSGRYNEPRIHFAVNCASIGCPALRADAYHEATLDAQLEDQTARFLSDRARNALHGSTLKVSPIFKWYRDDFEKGWRGASSMPAFLALYANDLGLSPEQTEQLESGAIKIEFTSYDWNLNGS
jgi:hypothetical protein